MRFYPEKKNAIIKEHSTFGNHHYEINLSQRLYSHSESCPDKMESVKIPFALFLVFLSYSFANGKQPHSHTGITPNQSDMQKIPLLLHECIISLVMSINSISGHNISLSRLSFFYYYQYTRADNMGWFLE